MASPKRRGRPFWSSLVQKYEQSSDITQKEFAQKYGVRTDTFRSWLYRLRREEASTASPSAPRFIEVDTSQVDPSPKQVTLELGELRLHLTALPDPGWLAELAALKEASSC